MNTLDTYRMFAKELFLEADDGPKDDEKIKYKNDDGDEKETTFKSAMSYDKDHPARKEAEKLKGGDKKKDDSGDKKLSAGDGDFDRGSAINTQNKEDKPEPKDKPEPRKGEDGETEIGSVKDKGDGKVTGANPQGKTQTYHGPDAKYNAKIWSKGDIPSDEKVKAMKDKEAAERDKLTNPVNKKRGAVKKKDNAVSGGALGSLNTLDKDAKSKVDPEEPADDPTLDKTGELEPNQKPADKKEKDLDPEKPADEPSDMDTEKPADEPEDDDISTGEDELGNQKVSKTRDDKDIEALKKKPYQDRIDAQSEHFETQIAVVDQIASKIRDILARAQKDSKINPKDITKNDKKSVEDIGASMKEFQRTKEFADPKHPKHKEFQSAREQYKSAIQNSTIMSRRIMEDPEFNGGNEINLEKEMEQFEEITAQQEGEDLTTKTKSNVDKSDSDSSDLDKMMSQSRTGRELGNEIIYNGKKYKKISESKDEEKDFIQLLKKNSKRFARK